MRFSLLCTQLCALVFFSACGNFEEKFGRERGGHSKLEISLPQSVGAGTLVNGVMVYVYNVAETAFPRRSIRLGRPSRHQNAHSA
jgi:hypothetical protein